MIEPVAHLDVSAKLVALTTTVCRMLTADGAVYRPLDEMVPTGGVNDQATLVSVVPVTDGINCSLCAASRFVVGGFTDTATIWTINETMA